MKKSVVCGVDGSADSQAALAVAARMADELDARSVLANAVEYAHSPSATAGALGPAARAPLTATLNEQVRAGGRLLEMTPAAALARTRQRWNWWRRWLSR